MSKAVKYFLALLLLCSGQTLLAQKDKVYLKNGSVLRGSILEVKAKELTIKIDPSTSLNVNISSIEGVRIPRRLKQFRDPQLIQFDSINRLPREERIYSQFMFGYLYGEDGNTLTALAGLSLDYSLHHKFKGKSSLGVGIGMDYYPAFQTFPVFIEFRRNFTYVPSGMFFYARFGYSMARVRSGFQGRYNNVGGDEMFGFGLGRHWSLGRNNFSITLGVRSQYLRTSAGAGRFESFTSWELTRMDMKVGLTF